jgi:hypothetical protein
MRSVNDFYRRRIGVAGVQLHTAHEGIAGLQFYWSWGAIVVECGRRLRAAAKFPDGDTELFCLVGEVLLNSGAR